MTAISPPAYQQAGTYSARVDRLSAISALLQFPGTASRAASPVSINDGVKPSYQNNRLKVSAQSTPNMTVQLTSGWAYVQNDDIAAYGAYVVVNDGTITIPIGASSGSQYRIDTVIAKVLDAETLGTSNTATFEVVSGAYAASRAAATRGTIPPNCAILADVYVDAGVSSITNALISDARSYTVASGGIQPVTSTTDLDNGAPGQVRYRMDTDTFVYTNLAGTTVNLLQSAGASAIGQALWAIKSADTNRASTTTATNDPHLTLAIPSAGTYQITLQLFLGGGSSAGNFLMNFLYPTGRLSFSGWGPGVSLGVGSTVGSTEFVARTGSTSGTSPQVAYSGSSSQPVGISIQGVLTATVAGTFVLQWAQFSGSTTATVLQQDSWMRAVRVA